MQHEHLWCWTSHLSIVVEEIVTYHGWHSDFSLPAFLLVSLEVTSLFLWYHPIVHPFYGCLMSPWHFHMNQIHARPNQHHLLRAWLRLASRWLGKIWSLGQSTDELFVLHWQSSSLLKLFLLCSFLVVSCKYADMSKSQNSHSLAFDCSFIVSLVAVVLLL